MGTEKDTRTNFHAAENVNGGFFVRGCTVDDLEGVIAVNEKELPEDYPYFFYKSILDNFSDSFLVACAEDDLETVVGYVMWRVERTPSKDSLKLVNKGHLVSIAVFDHYRRKGVAAALLAKSMPMLNKHRIKEFVLEVRLSNYPAINLYKKFDYETSGIKKKYYKDGENAYYMIYKVNNV